MLFKCNDHLHPLVEYERGVVDQRIEEDNNLHIFKKIANTIGPSMKVINRELLILSTIKWMSKTSNVHFNRGKNMRICFLQLVFWAKQILGLHRSQIEIKKIIFSLIGILVNFRRCHLQSKKLDKLIFVNKN
jgi:hypothetical protein